MDIESVLKDLIAAGVLANKMDNMLNEAGFCSNPYFSIYGHIADAIYKLVGEHTDTFEESETYLVMNSNISDKARLSILVNAYNKAHPNG